MDCTNNIPSAQTLWTSSEAEPAAETSAAPAATEPKAEEAPAETKATEE